MLAIWSLVPLPYLTIKWLYGTSLVVQRLRICLPMQRTWVQSLVWKIPHVVKQLSPCTTTESKSPRTMLNERSCRSERMHLNKRVASTHHKQRKPACSDKTQHSRKYSKIFNECMVYIHTCVHTCSVAMSDSLWQAPLFMGFPTQKYRSGLPFPPPGDLPNPGIEPACPASSALAGGLPLSHLGSPYMYV